MRPALITLNKRRTRYAADMIELALTQAAFAPERRRVTRDYLNATTIWPAFGQAKRRGEYLETCAAVRALEEAEAVPATMHAGIARHALHAMPPASFEPELTQRKIEGLIVADFYASALKMAQLGLPVSVRNLMEYQTRPESRKAHAALDHSPSKLRDLLREFRPSLHLWTAHFVMLTMVPDWVTDDMPCPPDHVPEFLALAEFIAESLASIRLKQRGKDHPLIAPGADLWRVPEKLLLPPVNWPDGLRPGAPPLDAAGSDPWKLAALLPRD